MSHPPIVATDARDARPYPLDFETVHRQGIPHRSVHLEIAGPESTYLVWHRPDGRLEIPGGHVDWLTAPDRPETYQEAALRELAEELALPANWGAEMDAVCARLRARMLAVAHIVNQLPSSHGRNNEWVTVFRLHWQDEWRDPCSPGWTLSAEGTSPCWLSVDEIEQRGLARPARISASLRLFLRRRGVLAPVTG
jgi:8-oxo-dGTP pyrophosphatase MutT (NUDIX family)